jgi:serine/threonine protein kinase
MAAACVFCSESLADGIFCPSCGSRQPPAQLRADPFIGRVVAERYEIIDLVDTGGMGRVYRAVQRALDRVVAIKIVQPATATVRADEIVARFMIEARTASRLNHPNVVSIFDFGRVSTAPDAELFLAMEFLAGPSLRDVIAKGPELSFTRIADILRQTLAALGEAHHLGITHRDVKPDNIVLERLRGEGDHVKVIDFGIAKVHAERPLTDKGRVMGTPDYIAPEHAAGAPAGPSVDLYAVGVILFELLTGRVPFEAPSAIETLRMHATAPRPDPRLFAPARGITPALVDVCFRALAIDPRERYADAEALARAIAEATAAPWTAIDARLFPSRPPLPVIDVRPSGVAETIPPAREAALKKRARASKRAAAPIALETETAPLVGRDEHLSWLRDQLQAPRGVTALVMWGRTGMGRTRILAEAMTIAKDAGSVVLVCPSEPVPRYEVGYTYLRALLATLAGATQDDGRLFTGAAAENDLLAALGLSAIFAHDGAHASDSAVETRRGVNAALRWAARKAVERADGALVVAVLDDVDRADGISRAVLGDFVEATPIDGLVMIMSCEARPAAAVHGGVRDKQLLGLSREDAQKLVARTSVLPGAPSAKNRRGRLIEPLYLEQYLRWRAESRAEKVPAGLVEIIAARLHGLAPAQRRVLQAVAVVGAVSVVEAARLLGKADGVDDAFVALTEAGFLVKCGESYRLAHAAFARAVLNAAPSGAVEQLHSRAAEALETARGGVELRAHHAIRARPDFEAFMLLEECARIRTLCGDDEGAIAALSDGYAASRTQMVRGDAEAAASAWSVFGRKLASALLRAGHVDPAHGVLTEILEAMGPRDATRVPVCEHLAVIAEIRERHDEAERWRREARSIAAGAHPPRESVRSTARGSVRGPTFRRANSESAGLRPSYLRVTEGARRTDENDDDPIDEAPPSNRSR